MTAPTQDLDVLFPFPSSPPSPLSPIPPAGITRESTEALVRLLKENHTKFHCFFNDRGFHNHLSHHLLAAYFLGAAPSLLQAVFDYHATYQRDAFPSPAPIDKKNWKEHLGDHNYYRSYLNFFASELVQNGLDPMIEKYFFSTDANWGNNEQDKHPEMLSRLLAGLVHPFIFAGHGMEFGQLGMVAEGFAQAAAHSVPTSKLLSRELLAPPTRPSMFFTTALVSRLSLTSTTVPTSTSTHPFNLLARILKDPRLASEKASDNVDKCFEETLETRGEIIREYAEQWEADATSPEAAAQRVEELAWVVTLVYGVGGWRKDQPFKADFFTMHLVTSSLFIPSTLTHLSSSSKRIFLRSYFAVLLGYWVSQGRAKLNIEAFYANTERNPTAVGPQPVPHPDTLDKKNITPNPWYPLLQSTLMHPVEHLLKLERALAHYASLFGTKPKGHFSGTELQGAENLDGSVFLRVAWLSLNRIGWVREGKEQGGWDFDGFFDEK